MDQRVHGGIGQQYMGLDQRGGGTSHFSTLTRANKCDMDLSQPSHLDWIHQDHMPHGGKFESSIHPSYHCVERDLSPA